MSEILETRLLKSFAMVAETGSFGIAAHRLHLTQSAVSHQIKSLEQQAGTALFERPGKRAQLTAAGKILLRHTRDILERLQLAQQALRERNGQEQGALAVGAPANVCEYLLPPVIREFRARYPRHGFTVEPNYTIPTIERLKNGAIDLGIVVLPLRVRSLRIENLFADELFAVVAPSHPWATKKVVPLAELPEQSFILYGSQSLHFQSLQKFCRQHSLRVPNIVQAGEYGLIKKLVQMNLGVSLLAPWTMDIELRQKALVAVPLGDHTLRRQWGIVTRAGKRLTASQNSFISLCHSLIGSRSFRL